MKNTTNTTKTIGKQTIGIVCLLALLLGAALFAGCDAANDKTPVVDGVAGATGTSRIEVAEAVAPAGQVAIAPMANENPYATLTRSGTIITLVVRDYYDCAGEIILFFDFEYDDPSMNGRHQWSKRRNDWAYNEEDGVTITKTFDLNAVDTYLKVDQPGLFKVWAVVEASDWYSFEYTFTSNIITYEVRGLPPNPTKEGHTFVGWYLNAALTQPYDGRPITSDLQLYAKFNINRYTVTFYTNGGNTVNSQTVNWNTSVGEPEVNRNGYDLGGWYTDAACTQSFNFGTAVKSNMNLYVKWTATNYTITYNANGGTVSGATSYNIETATVTLPTPTRTGYTFGGWFENSGFSGTAVTQIPKGSTGNKTYYAKWTVIQYAVTIVYGNDTTDTTTQYDYGTKVTKPTDPTKEGHIFKGFYTAQTGGTVYNFDTAVTGNLTIYAQWEIKRYTVTFLLSEGEVYRTLEVDHGTVLTEAPAVQALMRMITFDESDPETVRFMSAPVTEAVTVSVNLTDFSLWLLDYWWTFAIAVGVLLLLVIALIVKIARG